VGEHGEQRARRARIVTARLTGSTRLWIALSLAFHLVAAACSVGFYHYDEHFQILEPVSFLLGRTPAQALPWEFPAEIRPWLQPLLLYGIARLCRALGVDDPFLWAWVFRLLSALAGWVAVVLMVRAAGLWFPDPYRRWAAALTALLWFLPFQHARTSSESWGGIAFFLGLGLWLLGERPGAAPRPMPAGTGLCIGVLWGLSFHFRYHMAIAILSVLAWAWFVGRRRWQSLAPVAVGLLVAAGAGLCIDRWGYGHWTWTPWRYLVVNLVEGASARFGTHPVWHYVTKVFLLGPPPLSLAFLVFPLIAFVYRPWHLLTWTVVPFVVVHSLIGHKEIRFLWPLSLALPALVVLGAQVTLERREAVLGMLAGVMAWLRRPWALRTLIAFNATLLLLASVAPARLQMSVYAFLHREGVTTLYSTGESPYRLAKLDVYYYRPERLELRAHASPMEVRTALETDAIWLIDGRATLEGAWAALSPYCRVRQRSVPGFLLSPPGRELLRRTRAPILTVYRCHP
jgi:phosphatidylinositol glycan class B